MLDSSNLAPSLDTGSKKNIIFVVVVVVIIIIVLCPGWSHTDLFARGASHNPWPLKGLVEICVFFGDEILILMSNFSETKQNKNRWLELVVFFFLTLKKASFDIGDFYAYVQNALLGANFS